MTFTIQPGLKSLLWHSDLQSGLGEVERKVHQDFIGWSCMRLVWRGTLVHCTNQQRPLWFLLRPMPICVLRPICFHLRRWKQMGRSTHIGMGRRRNQRGRCWFVQCTSVPRQTNRMQLHPMKSWCTFLSTSPRPLCKSLCHKSDFNPGWIVNVILLFNLSYVTLISSYWLVPDFFIGLFLRNDSPWWLKNQLLWHSEVSCF